jgi:hypothetical protein
VSNKTKVSFGAVLTWLLLTTSSAVAQPCAVDVDYLGHPGTNVTIYVGHLRFEHKAGKASIDTRPLG